MAASTTRTGGWRTTRQLWPNSATMRSLTGGRSHQRGRVGNPGPCWPTLDRFRAWPLAKTPAVRDPGDGRGGQGARLSVLAAGPHLQGPGAGMAALLLEPSAGVTLPASSPVARDSVMRPAAVLSRGTSQGSPAPGCRPPSRHRRSADRSGRRAAAPLPQEGHRPHLGPAALPRRRAARQRYL
jgi:hypothetical protein